MIPAIKSRQATVRILSAISIRLHIYVMLLLLLLLLMMLLLFICYFLLVQSGNTCYANGTGFTVVVVVVVTIVRPVLMQSDWEDRKG